MPGSPAREGSLSEAAKLEDGLGTLEQLRRGDADAWEALVRTHGPKLLGLARRILGNERDAEDCLQDGLLRARAGIEAFEGRAALSTWLYRIVANSALMMLRSRKRRAELPIDGLLPAFDRFGHRIATRAAVNPEDLVLRRESVALVREALDQLPDIHRVVLLLRDFEALSMQEIADLLEITVTATKLRLHRARAALKGMIEKPRPASAAKPGRFAGYSIEGLAARLMPFMLSCRDFEQFILDFLEGTLPQRDRRLFSVHLKMCRRCRDYVARYKATIALARRAYAEGDDRLPEGIPEELVRAVVTTRRNRKPRET